MGDYNIRGKPDLPIFGTGSEGHQSTLLKSLFWYIDAGAKQLTTDQQIMLSLLLFYAKFKQITNLVKNNQPCLYRNHAHL